MSLGRLRRSGGLAVLDPETGNVLRVIALQFNPDSLSRTVAPRGGSDEGRDAAEARRLAGPPQVTITVEAELDAVELADEEATDDTATAVGLHAHLAELEGLVRPPLEDVVAAHELASRGAVEILPPPTPDVLFVWGRHRVLPVRVTDLSINEEAFDAELNPLRATVSLTLRVLTVDDTGVDSRAGSRALAHHADSEALAARIRSTSTARLGVNL